MQEERNAAISLANKMVESVKFQATQVSKKMENVLNVTTILWSLCPINMFHFQARLYDGKEPIQFFVIFQTFIVYKVHICFNSIFIYF